VKSFTDGRAEVYVGGHLGKCEAGMCDAPSGGKWVVIDRDGKPIEAPGPPSSPVPESATPAPGPELAPSSQPLTDGQLQPLTKGALRLLRNEVFARHGFTFKSADLREHFSKQAWYAPNPNFNEADFSALERSNLELIKKHERR
jgi:hypothetical protein